MHIVQYLTKRQPDNEISQLIEYKTRNTFLQNHAENEAGRPVADPILLVKKALYEVNTSGLQLSFNIFR